MLVQVKFCLYKFTSVYKHNDNVNDNVNVNIRIVWYLNKKACFTSKKACTCTSGGILITCKQVKILIYNFLESEFKI
jgi:hypothetical protein